MDFQGVLSFAAFAFSLAPTISILDTLTLLAAYLACHSDALAGLFPESEEVLILFV